MPERSPRLAGLPPELRRLAALPERVQEPEAPPRPGLRGWLARLRPRRWLVVAPLSFEDAEAIPVLLGASVRPWEWDRFKAWVVVRDNYDPAPSWEEWCSLVGSAEALARWAPVVRAWDRVNASFRLEATRRRSGSPRPPRPLATGRAPVDAAPAHAGPVRGAGLGLGAGGGGHAR